MPVIGRKNPGFDASGMSATGGAGRDLPSSETLTPASTLEPVPESGVHTTGGGARGADLYGTSTSALVPAEAIGDLALRGALQDPFGQLLQPASQPASQPVSQPAS
ncbi:hypothetical protein ACQPZG_04540 (plasmid) [Streptomyces sp. CA-294286]|uniref:hypothetical protein n=1 Tax=Streptomyces sp. CA-294286 TaxID=3240070 RepID=UPI003D8CB498